MLRVVLGRAHPNNEWNRKISGLQFKSSPGVQESMRLRGATNTILTIPRNHRGREDNLEANGELRGESSPAGGNERMVNTDEGSARI